MRIRSAGARRRGATLVEAAVVFLVFLTLILGALDLGIAVFRSHVLAGAARQAARQAVVHGSMATPLGTWGPAPVGPVTAEDPSPLPQAVAAYLPGLDPASVTVQAEWPDGGNAWGQRVRVTVTAPYQPALTGLFGAGPITLSATATMRIAH